MLAAERTMATEPAIVTAGWPEVSGQLARTGIFQEDQLNPETAPRILADLVRHRHGQACLGQTIDCGSRRAHTYAKMTLKYEAQH